MSACSKCGSELLEVPGHPSHHCTAPTNDSGFGIGDKVRVRDSDAEGEITHIVARPGLPVFATVYFRSALKFDSYNTDLLEHADQTPPPVQEVPAEVEALVLAELAKRVEARDVTVRALFGQDYPDGRKETFRSPLDQAKLGQVWRTDPDPRWVVVDAEALDAELRTYPGNLVTDVTISPADMPEALAVLAEHAPQLITETVRVADGVVEAALAQSKTTGKSAAAGIEMWKPGGTLTVKPDPNAGVVVERLVDAGVITWDGRPVLSATDEAAS
jgi:hypothetical protein